MGDGCRCGEGSVTCEVDGGGGNTAPTYPFLLRRLPVVFAASYVVPLRHGVPTLKAVRLISLPCLKQPKSELQMLTEERIREGWHRVPHPADPNVTLEVRRQGATRDGRRPPPFTRNPPS
jgi:hypothetical protein